MKTIIKVLVVVAIIAIIFMAGGYAAASSGWVVEVKNNADSRIGEAGYNKKEELVGDSDNISKAMKEVADPEIKRQQEELEQMLEDYYQMKIDGLADTPAYKNLEAQMEATKKNIFDRYKQDIDEAFE